LKKKKKKFLTQFIKVDTPEYPLLIQCIKLESKSPVEVFRFLVANDINLNTFLNNTDSLKDKLTIQLGLSILDFNKIKEFVNQYNAAKPTPIVNNTTM
jgi:hypothetical protein